MASTSSSSTDAKGQGKAFALPKSLLPCASSSSSVVYDVFLNHRGCDAKGLAQDIYDALKCKGLQVFLDKEELQHGASVPLEIENAMRNASLCVAILSPKYAESSWCLDELSFMVKKGSKIIPIFYNVEPSGVRWVAEGKGVYASAFYQHEKKRRYDAQKLEEWKTALYNVSFIYGHELKNRNKEEEGRVLKSIVNDVLKDRRIVPLEVARYSVGLNEIVEDFQKSAFKSFDREQHINIVGIVGMGGSGKTTLAKELYNRECPNIAKHTFIFDVRDAAEKNTLHNKQAKLLQDLLSVNFSLDNVTEGKGLLRTRLTSLRVLIVLDDVDHVEQIEALLPEKSIFASGSLIIVTTRELKVLEASNISCIYKMKPLNASQAKQLFCSHAFMKSDPIQEFEDVVEKFMNACQGLPLSLKVLGGQLYKKRKDYWVSQLDKISRILPKYIMKILKISFDALDREEKEMFLDTACFFLGEEKNLAIEVWNGSGWSGLYGWETLLNKCLIEVDQQNRICMHDHLRDMGREIAKEGSPCRLFPSSNPDICRLVQERRPIRGIMEFSTIHSSMVPSSDYKPFSKEYIELKPSSCRVQLLVADEVSEEYATLTKELRWLRLFGFQHSCIPSSFSLENLRILELNYAPHLEELWEDNMQQPPLQLRELIIRGVKNSFRFPRSIGRLGHLKKLSLTKVREGYLLQNLPGGFYNLQSLEYLKLEAALSSLPSRFGDLTNLRHLDLSGCCELKMLPDSFKQLKHLQYLNLECCRNLTFTEHNADILENITKLEYLHFDGCKGLQVLPHHITKQAFLRELDLSNTSVSELPSSIGQLERLEVLRIGSTALESLPDSLGNLSRLTRLEINSWEEMRSLPESLGRLTLLEYIEICGTSVESLPKAFGHLISLQTLSISFSPIRELIFQFEESSSLPRLKSIDLNGTSVSTISIPEDFCPSLETLDVVEDDCLVEIRTLPGTVKTITLESCERLKDIAGIRSVRNLQYLKIWSCPHLAELPSFAECAFMKEIKIKGCQISGKMEGLEQLTSLETLEVSTQWEVPGITSLEHAQGLRRLRLSAENTGAVEGCIKTLQKLPGDVRICARALGDVESVVRAFTSSNLFVVEACAHGDDGADSNDEHDEDDGEEQADEDGCRSTLKYRKTCLSVWQERTERRTWSLGDPKTCLSVQSESDMFVVCFIINCLSPSARALTGMEDEEDEDGLDCVELREGKWVWIHAFFQDAIHGMYEGAIDEFGLKIQLDEGSRVEKGLVGTGEEREVKLVLNQVLEALKM